jgi:hypothetical protein
MGGIPQDPTWKERIEFYNTLEIVVEQPVRLRLEKNKKRENKFLDYGKTNDM